jgi:hypothetical protein
MLLAVFEFCPIIFILEIKFENYFIFELNYKGSTFRTINKVPS